MEVTLKTKSMAGKRDLSTAREWGREILKTHELQEYNSAPENALIPVIDVTQIQADAQPRKMTISGVVNSAIEAGIIDPAGGGGIAAVVDHQRAGPGVVHSLGFPRESLPVALRSPLLCWRRCCSRGELVLLTLLR